MKKILLSSAAVLMFVGGAYAADLPSRAYAPIAPPPVFTWTGFYLGINGGYGGDEFKYPVSAGAAGSGSAHITSSGFVAGGQVGYNYEFAGSPIVVGVEADFDFSDIKGDIGANATIGGTPVSLSAESKLEDLGTVRGRLGYAWNRALLYVTGGYAFAEEKSSVNASVPGFGTFTGSKSADADGWTIGAGLEYALTNNLTVKAEYLYVSLDKTNLINTAFGGVPVTVGARSTNHIVRAGLNYKFNLF